MKAILNVNGKKLNVSSISFYQGEINSVNVFDEQGEPHVYYDENASWTPKGTLRIDLNKFLVFPTIEQDVSDKWIKLVDHLEDFIVDEDNMLTHLAIDAMEGDELPFEELSLIEKQKEYKLMRERVNGVIDTVEEVKAFMEGWYKDEDSTTTE